MKILKKSVYHTWLHFFPFQERIWTAKSNKPTRRKPPHLDLPATANNTIIPRGQINRRNPTGTPRPQATAAVAARAAAASPAATAPTATTLATPPATRQTTYCSSSSRGLRRGPGARFSGTAKWKMRSISREKVRRQLGFICEPTRHAQGYWVIGYCPCKLR